MGLTTSIAVFLALYAVWSLYHRQTVCARCLGRGKHRDDCPMRKLEDD